MLETRTSELSSGAEPVLGAGSTGFTGSTSFTGPGRAGPGRGQMEVSTQCSVPGTSEKWRWAQRISPRISQLAGLPD